MHPAASPSRASRRMLFACLALALVAGIAMLFRYTRNKDGDGELPAPAVAASKHAPRLKETNELKPAASTVVPGNVAVAAPSAVLPGHEGHGDECAQCLAERKLVDYREDFALLHFSRIQEEFEIDAPRSAEVLDACRLFARSVLTEWSFSDKKPRLPEDAALEARRSEILGPLLGTLSRKSGDTL